MDSLTICSRIFYQNSKSTLALIANSQQLIYQWLISTDTSRLPRPGELNGKDYHFVSREQMNEDIQAGKFIEYGEYKGNLYGTNAESVTSLVNAGYVCLLSPHYQALKMLRTSQLKPYVIYIKPPRFEILKETRYDSKARSTFDEANSRGFTVRLTLVGVLNWRYMPDNTTYCLKPSFACRIHIHRCTWNEKAVDMTTICNRYF